MYFVSSYQIIYCSVYYSEEEYNKEVGPEGHIFTTIIKEANFVATPAQPRVRIFHFSLFAISHKPLHEKALTEVDLCAVIKDIHAEGLPKCTGSTLSTAVHFTRL